MKKLILAAALIAASTAAASAADLPLKAPAPVMAAPLPSWAGFYAGGNVGGDWGTSRTSLDVTSSGDFFTFPICLPPANGCQVNVVDVRNAGAQRLHPSGFTGGVQAGYNWQAGAVVYGVEADFNYFRSAASGIRTVGLVSGLPATVTVGQSESTDWLFTLRGRLGWAFSPAWLVYATGGLAVTDLHSGWTFSETRFGNVASSSFSNTRAGWTIGAGVETKFAAGWRLGLEYLFVDFDTSTSTVPVVLLLGGGTVPQNFTQTVDLQSHIVRVKLNYSWGGPVVAKY
jgi:outer membrane immunogenic protein